MENNTENTNSQNSENAHSDLETLGPAELKEQLIKTREEKASIDEKNRQLFVRAKKAEGFEQDEEGNWIKVVERSSKPEKKEKKDKQSDELDYGMKAYLRSEGIESTEFDFVLEQMEESGIRDIEKLVKNSYFKSQLKEMRDKVSVENATPGSSRASGENAKTKVDYWLAKGELPPNTPENIQLRRDVLNKRLEVEKNASKFSPQSVISQ